MNTTVSLCFKCKKNTGSVPSRDGAAKLYCVDCFSEFCTKTFRDSLLGACAFPSEEPIPIGVSGGPNSFFLLYQLGVLQRQGEMRGGEGKTRFFLLPFHLVEEDLVLPPVSEGVGMTQAEGTLRSNTLKERTGLARQERMAAFRDTITRQFAALQEGVERQMATWQWANVRLFETGALRVFRYSDFFSGEELLFLQTILHHPHISLTCREELYTRIRHNILMTAAKQLCKEWKQRHRQQGVEEAPTQREGNEEGSVNPSAWTHFVSGDNAVRCCINALHSIVVGGGASLMLQRAGFRCYSHSVVEMRPLRMLLPKEVVFFNRIHGIVGSYTPALSTGTSLSSFYRVLEAFVCQTTLQHRTIIFNVLTVVSRLDAEALFPLTASVLDSQRGIETMDKKRMVFAKAGYRHAFLQQHPPPFISYSPVQVRASGVDAKGSSCFSVQPSTTTAAAAAAETGILEEVICHVCGSSFCPPKAFDQASSVFLLCVPCRECVNDTFASKCNVSADPLMDIFQRLAEWSETP